MLVALISSEANLAKADHYRDISRRLAYVRGVSPDAARALARDGKAVVWIDNGLHASEVATAQHAFLLAHRVATDDSAEMREIRDNVILVLLPTVNPDGMNLVVDWYRKHLNTPNQDSPMPWLYQKYIGHDNNRDAYMQTQAETRVVNTLLYKEWLPQIMYNQHQAGWPPPRMFVPPFPDPFNPNIDSAGHSRHRSGGRRDARSVRARAQARRGLALPVLHLVQRLDPHRGVLPQHDRDPHRDVAPVGDAVHLRSEALPARVRQRRVGDRAVDRAIRAPGWAARCGWPMPWTTCSPARWPCCRWRRSIESSSCWASTRSARGRSRRAPPTRPSPTSFLPSSTTRRRPPCSSRRSCAAPSRCIARTARSAPTARSYPAGTWVVRMDQPFRPFAKDLLEPQRYPDLRVVSWRPAAAALRHRGLDAGLPDGRQRGRRHVAVRRHAHAAVGLPARRGSRGAASARAAASGRASDDVECRGRRGPAGGGRRHVCHRAAGQRRVPRGEPSAGVRRAGGAGDRASGRRRRRPVGGIVSRDGQGFRAGPATGRRGGRRRRGGAADRSAAAYGDPAGSRGAHRALQELGRQHGRGMDPVAARAVRVPVHDAHRRRRARRRAARSLRRDHPARSGAAADRRRPPADRPAA